MKYLISLPFFMGTAYILNKYGLNMMDHPLDFILTMSLMSIGQFIIWDGN